jgi:hypothetical protein
MRLLLVLTCAMVLVDTAFYAALTPLVLHFAEEFGLSKSSAGILIGAFGVGMLLRSAPSGYLMARGEANGACGTRFGVWRELALRVRGRSVGARRAPAAAGFGSAFLGFGVHVARDASPGRAQGVDDRNTT